jgi:DNA (cytosine-5)-methyltransferase 1
VLTPQFTLDIHRELVVDLFAGGGGASTGIEQAIGRHSDIAINHDREAVAMHQANHPQTRHFVSDVFEVDPLEVTEGRPVGLLWASPDCKHFSKAKGGKPVSKKIRSLAWVVVKWAKAVRPRVIFLENVEEFQTWGPLGEDNRPCPERKGRTFRRWIRSLEQLGYVVEHRELRACDFGAPTIRKRFFLVARCDGAPIAWPEPTHGAPDSLPVRQKKLKPWRTAAECIDWSQACPSIFERTRPLAEATLRRIAKGVMRYVVDAKEPFIVSLTHQGGERVEAVSQPFKTITGAHRGEKALAVARVAPLLTEHANASGQRVFAADDPLRTQVAQVKGGHFALVSAFLAQHNNHRGTVPSDGRPVTAPVSTVTASGAQQSVITANLVGVGARAGQSRPRGVDEPVATITAKYDTALATSHLVKLRGTARDGQPVDTPLHTVSAQGQHFGEVRAFLIKYYGTDQDPRLAEPMHTIPTHDRFGVVMVHGEPYAIVDIGLRMLNRRELFNAQGFPPSYIIEWGTDPFTGQRIKLTHTASIRMCGNSVCPPMARALVAANYAEQAVVAEAA